MAPEEEKSLVSKCIFCGANPAIELNNVFDTRFGINDKYKIGRCASCGTEQILPLPSIKQLKDLYETYYNFGGERGTGYTVFREYFFSSFLYPFWLIVDGDVSFHVEKGSGRLLDIGCNEGRGLSIYQKHGFDAEGLELNEQAAAEARKRGFSVHTESLEKFHPKEPYDVVVLSNVLEHSLDPKHMLSHAHRILKSGGHLWISCPNNQSWLRRVFGRYWINWHVPFHIVHFSKNSLSKILVGEHFRVVTIQQETPAIWAAHSLISFLVAKPGQQTKSLRNPLLISFLIILIRIFLFPEIWFGNWLGHGDCIVLKAMKC
jgi:2-polyprenyl-3-methyl-5-hydroxy-6-metoxy-1,4-benzoquinol methylase